MRTKLCLAVSLALWSFGAVGPAAADDQPPAAIADKVQLCASCHGDNGLPVVENAPIIAGQQLFYILVQLRDFRAARRASDIMTPIAKDLSDADMKALAAWFSARPWPPYHEAAGGPDIARARTLNDSVGCTGCHLNGYLGSSGVPRLANQKADYLQTTLIALRDKTRANAAAMSALVHQFSDDDAAAMSHYLAGL